MATNYEDMKVTEVKAVYPKYQHSLAAWRVHFWQIVVRVETDAGLVGLGYGGGGVAAVEVVNRHFRELLLDRDVDSPADIAAIWDDLYAASLPYGRRGLAVMALSGVDLALWDLLAKAEGLPVYKLIGRRQKEQVRAYATGVDPEWYRDLGFTAHKFPHRWTGDLAEYEQAANSAARARRLFGPEALLMVDSYMSWDAAVTQEMARRLAEYDIYWFEDVLTPDHLTEQARLRELVKPVLIAGGEHEFTPYGFAEVARHQALDIWQPDVTWCGGITATLRIIDLAEGVGARVVPHRGGEVWGLHIIVATACDDLAEVLPGQHHVHKDQLWFDEPIPVNGYLSPTEAPGFGVTLNEALI
jgi:L-rhamnonate dehydratase